MIVAAKKQECQSKYQGAVTGDIVKEEAEAEKPPDPTHEEPKEIFGFTNLSVHHSDGDYVTNFGFCQVGTNTEAVPVPNYTTLGLDETDEAIMSKVADTKTKTRMEFSDIVHGNQPPKSVARVNPVLPIHKNPVTQKKQVARFKLVWTNLHLDKCVTYHTKLVTWLLENVGDADTTLVGH